MQGWLQWRRWELKCSWAAWRNFHSLLLIWHFLSPLKFFPSGADLKYNCYRWTANKCVLIDQISEKRESNNYIPYWAFPMFDQHPTKSVVVAFVIVWWLGKLLKETTWQHGPRLGTTWHCWDSFQSAAALSGLHGCFCQKGDFDLMIVHKTAGMICEQPLISIRAEPCIWPNL